jgi:hypothetical protein
MYDLAAISIYFREFKTDKSTEEMGYVCIKRFFSGRCGKLPRSLMGYRPRQLPSSNSN